jgi:hypothetical protein
LKKILFAAALSICAMSLPLMAPAAGQTASAGVRSMTTIGGTPVACRDFRGRNVTTIKVDDLGDVGRAWVVNMTPYIVMDEHLLHRLPAKLQLFFYGHECAHHVLGHWYKPSSDNEKEADCWAIRYGRDAGLFRRQEVVDFAPWLASSKGSRFGHLPGPLRARFLLECFDSSEPLLISNERKSLFMR